LTDIFHNVSPLKIMLDIIANKPFSPSVRGELVEP
jgi:hypothetical protein